MIHVSCQMTKLLRTSCQRGNTRRWWGDKGEETWERTLLLWVTLEFVWNTRTPLMNSLKRTFRIFTNIYMWWKSFGGKISLTSFSFVFWSNRCAIISTVSESQAVISQPFSMWPWITRRERWDAGKVSPGSEQGRISCFQRVKNKKNKTIYELMM